MCAITLSIIVNNVLLRAFRLSICLSFLTSAFP